MREVYLTTEDNPYDPADEFDDWYAFDTATGYYTLEYIDRLTSASKYLSDEYNEAAWESAIDEICQFNITGNYKKVVKE